MKLKMAPKKEKRGVTEVTPRQSVPYIPK